MDKYIVAYPYNGTLLSTKTEMYQYQWCKQKWMNLQKHNTKSKEADTKIYILLA